MTTPLTKAVSRRTTRYLDAGRRIVVILEPGDVIGFRLEKCRRVFRLPLLACYHLAVKREVALLKAQKRRR